MTRTRSIALIFFSALLFPVLMGQQAEPAADNVHLSEPQINVLESMATDSVGGELSVPNVFTPNGDLVNDEFKVSTDGTTVYAFSVFTRIGTRVYHSKSPQISWDGKTLDGIEMKEGVYYYVIEEEGDKKERKAGFMHLFR
jgi:gliding motility-associated-like protein